MTFVVGLTGGIGSGKTTVAKLFSQHGITYLDADQFARKVVEPNQDGLLAVVEHFGRSVLNDAGELDRAALRQIVFNDPVELKRLENILHPMIRKMLVNAIEQVSSPYCIVEIQLLAEQGVPDYIDSVLVVDADTEAQIKRVAARSGLQRDEIEKNHCLTSKPIDAQSDC